MGFQRVKTIINNMKQNNKLKTTITSHEGHGHRARRGGVAGAQAARAPHAGAQSEKGEALLRGVSLYGIFRMRSQRDSGKRDPSAARRSSCRASGWRAPRSSPSRSAAPPGFIWGIYYNNYLVLEYLNIDLKLFKTLKPLNSTYVWILQQRDITVDSPDKGCRAS